MILIKTILIINIFYQTITYSIKNFYFQLSYIKLKINKIGSNNILGKSFKSAYPPNEVLINGIKIDSITYNYKFNQTNNDLVLMWNNSIKNTANMFIECSSIIEIDLSNFDSSLVTDMSYMFYKCISLVYLNLSNLKNFDKNNLDNIGNIFRNVPENIAICINIANSLKIF